MPSWLAQFTKLGHPATVLITPDELNSLEETFDILSYDETLKEILEAQAQRTEKPIHVLASMRSHGPHYGCHFCQVGTANSQSSSRPPLPAPTPASPNPSVSPRQMPSRFAVAAQRGVVGVAAEWS